MSGFINSVTAAAYNIKDSTYKAAKSISQGNIFDLIKKGNYEGLKLHLEEYPQDISILKKDVQFTPLTYAYLEEDMENNHNRKDIIDLFIEKGGLNIRNGKIILNVEERYYLNRSTPLLFAILTKNFEMATDLIERGADVVDKDKNFAVTGVNPRDKNTAPDVNAGRKITPLVASIEFANPIITTMLLKKMNKKQINEKINDYYNAFREAFDDKKYEMIMLLIQYGADLTETGSYGDTYLHQAINKDFPLYVIEALIEKYPAIINKVNDFRHESVSSELIHYTKIPPLVDACRIGNLPLIDLLLRKGADPNHLYIDPYKNTRKISPLIDAVINVNLPTTRLLLKYNTKPINGINITHHVGHGQYQESRLFDYFVTIVVDNVAHSYEDKKNMVSLLLEHGATKNKNFDYSDVHPYINKILTYYQYSLSVASLKANDIYPHLDPDSQKQFADYIVKDQPDEVPQYWKDNNDKVDYIEKNMKNMKTEEMRLNASYRFKKFLDESRFKSQEYYNDKLNEIHQYVLTNQNPNNPSEGGKKTRRTHGGKVKTPHGGKVKTPHGGKAKTPHGGKAKTRRYKKA
jgi:ankyrin repeat protein